MKELFGPVEAIHIYMLLLGSISYTLAVLVRQMRTGKFRVIKWIRENLIPHIGATLLGICLLAAFAQIPELEKKISSDALKWFSWLLGASADFAVYQFDNLTNRTK